MVGLIFSVSIGIFIFLAAIHWKLDSILEELKKKKQ